MTIHDAVAMRIVKLMHSQGITQYRLEQDAGIFHGAMDRILQGKTKPFPSQRYSDLHAVLK